MNTLKTYRIGKRPLPVSVVRRALEQRAPIDAEDYVQPIDFRARRREFDEHLARADAGLRQRSSAAPVVRARSG